MLCSLQAKRSNRQSATVPHRVLLFVLKYFEAAEVSQQSQSEAQISLMLFISFVIRLLIDNLI